MLSESNKRSYHKIYRRKCPICGTEFETFNPRIIYDCHYCSRRGKRSAR